MGMLIRPHRREGVVCVHGDVVISLFSIVGLMSGRTPEYLGIKNSTPAMSNLYGHVPDSPIIILVPTVVAYATGATSAIRV